MVNAQPPGGAGAGRGPEGGAPRPARSPLQAVIYWTLVMGVWALIFIVAFFAVFSVDLPDTSKLYDVKRQPSISYLDRSGGLVAVRGSQFAPPVDLDKLPPYVPKAFVAIEDRWYYWHFGFNPWGIVRSEIYNWTHRGGGPLRGGSTITQQLARALFLTPNQTYRRKAQELIPGGLAGGQVLEETDPRALSEPASTSALRRPTASRPPPSATSTSPPPSSRSARAPCWRGS